MHHQAGSSQCLTFRGSEVGAIHVRTTEGALVSEDIVHGFRLEYPVHRTGAEIEQLSLQTILEECKGNAEFEKFTQEQKEIAIRLIHASSFQEGVLKSLHFTDDAPKRIADLLRAGAYIICDTQMMVSGLSKVYLNKYHNESICRVGDDDVANEALATGKTRSAIAVQKIILEHKDQPLVLACGNAPTFLYAAIETILKNSISTKQIALVGLPVGFVNVTESKNYALNFCHHFDAAGIFLMGRMGSSPMTVSVFHAIYKMMDRNIL